MMEKKNVTGLVVHGTRVVLFDSVQLVSSVSTSAELSLRYLLPQGAASILSHPFVVRPAVH